MFLKYNYPALLWALVILILCGIPGNDIPKLTFLQWLKPDKIVHLVLFGTQSFLLIRGFKMQIGFPHLSANAKVYAVIISIVYGCVIEILQEYCFINRSGEVFDAVADAVGALIGLWIYNWWMKRKIAKAS